MLQQEDLVQLKGTCAIGIVTLTQYDSESDSDFTDGLDLDGEFSDYSTESEPLQDGQVRVMWRHMDGKSLKNFNKALNLPKKANEKIVEGVVAEPELKLLDRAYQLGDAVAHPDGNQSGIVSNVQLLLSLTALQFPYTKVQNVDARLVSCHFSFELQDIVCFKDKIGIVVNFEIICTVKPKLKSLKPIKFSAWQFAVEEIANNSRFSDVSHVKLVDGCGIVSEDDYYKYVGEAIETLYPGVQVELQLADKMVSGVVQSSRISRLAVEFYFQVPFKQLKKPEVQIIKSLKDVQLLSYRNDLNLERSSVVRFLDSSYVVDSTLTEIDVRWQDGSIGQGISATLINPVMQLDDDELWPGDVVFQFANSNPYLVHSVNNSLKTASVWQQFESGASRKDAKLCDITRILESSLMVGIPVINRTYSDPEQLVGFILARSLTNQLKIQWLNGIVTSMSISDCVCIVNPNTFDAEVWEGLHMEFNKTCDILPGLVAHSVAPFTFLINEATKNKVKASNKWFNNRLSDEELQFEQFAHMQFLSPHGNFMFRQTQDFYGVGQYQQRVMLEAKLLSKAGCLPDNVFVASYDNCSNCFRAVIFVDDFNSCYYGLCLVLDIMLRTDYPNSPPMVKYHTWFSNLWASSSSSVKLNPNLNTDGSICLSLLGTHTDGGDETSAWSSNFEKCNLLRVILSIQGLVLGTEEPWLNEDGWWKQGDSDVSTSQMLDKEIRMRAYKQRATVLTFLHIRWLLEGYKSVGEFPDTKLTQSKWIQNLTDQQFHILVDNFYKAHLPLIKVAARAWLSECGDDHGYADHVRKVLELTI